LSSHYVKLARGDWETVLGTGTKEECKAQADALNEQYQTDEYYVEAYDSEKVWKMPTREQIEKILKKIAN
jgi:hypothetical protein